MEPIEFTSKTERSRDTYRHTQRGTLILALCLPILVFVFCVSLIAGQWLPAIIMTIIMVPLMTLFSSLTVEVDASEPRWFFGPGLWTYRLFLREPNRL